ncbi:MAG TPA: response regulator, partial [Candidatus Binatia bacterium]
MEPNPKQRTATLPAQAGRGASPARRSVLVIDDEENFLTLLHWFLTQRGYQVATASSADQALVLLDECVFDVALLDIRLGTSDGMALLEELTQRSPELKVFMMTAY